MVALDWRPQVMRNKSFKSHLWVMASLGGPFFGLVLTFLPHKGGACQRSLELGSSHPLSEWGAHFCLLHLLTPVGAIAVRGLLSGLAGT